MPSEEMPERIWLDADSYNGAVGFAHPEKHKRDGWPAYIRADLCASGQQVQVLEWYDCADGSSHDHDCQYEIEQNGRQWRLVRASTGPGGYLGHHQYRKEAKEAAQADYERRILAALTPAPQPEGQGRALTVTEDQAAEIDAAQTEAVPVAWRYVERKFYRSEWPLTKLLEARNGGLVTDDGEAWVYAYTHKDGTGGEYDLLRRREPAAPAPWIAEADIEIMARAMCESDMADFDAPSSQHTANGQDPEDQREYWRDKARIALRALANGGSDAS